MKHMLAHAALAAFIAGFVSAALAQTTPPYDTPATVGTSQAQVIGPNPQRNRIVFVNPNASTTVAVCPQYRRDTATLLTCAVNGPGSITILPLGSFELGINSPYTLPGAWNAVASAGGASLTVLEFQ